MNGSNKAATYQFIDKDPLTIATYRLRQIDNDGKETLSKIITLSNPSKNHLKVYPSVTSQFLNIDIDEGAIYQVVNLLGQVVLSGKMSEQRLDVSVLSQGTYVLKIGTEVAKFIKQ